MHRDAPLRVFLARSEALKEVHYRLRYQVYCVENDYEPREAHPQGLERDASDTRAEHFLVRAGASHGRGRWIGTMRLIPATDRLAKPSGMAASSIEVSRLIACDPRHRGTSRVLYLLCQAAQAYAVDHGYEQLAFLIRPALARILERQGLPIEQEGEPCDYRGLRVPYRIDARAAHDGLLRWRTRLKIPAAQPDSHYTPVYWSPVLTEPLLQDPFTCGHSHPQSS